MTAYRNAPLGPPPQLLTPNSAAYAWGSRLPGPTCRMNITNTAVAANVVTLTVLILEGNIPAVGDLIYTYGTANDAGALNQTTGIAIASVSITATTGVGTITFALTASNLAPTADVGYALSTPGETAEVLAVGKSQQFAVNGYGVSWAYTCPSAPVSIAIQLEGAINDVDSEYTLIGTSQTAASGYNEIFATLPELVNFVRLHVTATSGGTNPTIIGKFLNSARPAGA